MSSLSNKTIVVTGGLQGIGKAIVEKIIQDGQLNLVLLAKDKTSETDEFLSHARTKYGVEARCVATDIRDEKSIADAVDKIVALYGSLDVVIHAATVMITNQAHHIESSHFSLSCDINARSTFFLAKYTYPHLVNSANGHFLNIAPPINLDPKILGSYTTYASSQYMRSMLTVGYANHPDWIKNEISVNALWPLKPYKTGENVLMYQSHTQQQIDQKDISIIGDAAHAIITKPYGTYSGEFFYDEEVLELAGVDFTTKEEPNFNANPQYARDHEEEDVFV